MQPIHHHHHLSSSSFNPHNTMHHHHHHHLQTILLSIFLGILLGLVLALLFSLSVKVILRHHHHYCRRRRVLDSRPQPPSPLFSPIIDPKSLLIALANNSQNLGGSYCRTSLDNGLTVAVKRVVEDGGAGMVGVSGEDVKGIGRLRHRNLMSLRATVRRPRGFLLVYDYMPVGSLRDAMERVRQDELQMGWEVRLRVAVGIVKGLKFLHFECNPRVLHCNLKPSNVMLDAEFEPRLGDYGLAKANAVSSTTCNGYMAPESCQNSRYTNKSDIYSFGVILAELLTGRDTTDPFFGEPGNGGSISKWLRQLQRAGEVQQALDRSMLLENGEGMEVEEELLMAVRIAGVCMSEYPADRPSSDELVPMLSQLLSC